MGGHAVDVTLYSSAFCAPCAAARVRLRRAGELVPGLSVTEIDVAAAPERAERDGIRSTPTIVVTGEGGAEVFRSASVPTMPQLLSALALAVPTGPGAGRADAAPADATA